jgi:hypothetical protein
MYFSSCRSCVTLRRTTKWILCCMLQCTCLRRYLCIFTRVEWKVVATCVVYQNTFQWEGALQCLQYRHLLNDLPCTKSAGGNRCHQQIDFSSSLCLLQTVNDEWMGGRTHKEWAIIIWPLHCDFQWSIVFSIFWLTLYQSHTLNEM